ncbi:hypothetical protein [Nocardioides sp. GXZ039]|uniref:hypothetical protein n=1 Tax=Nocardioides sp. GXZ039 TaxID=3136018 RepID=UPI0030F47062
MTLASGASAAVWHHDDETGARPSAGDIDQVRISAGEKVVTMRVEFNGRVPYQTDVFFDVDRSRKGPEFVASYNDDGGGTDQLFIDRAHGFSSPLDGARCKPRSVRLSDGGETLTARFRVGCLTFRGEKPDRLRVNVTTNDDFVTLDSAPARKRFGRWFAVG